MTGKIIKNISNLYVVLSNNGTYDCIPRGKFKNIKLTPLVGDNVIFNDKECVIEEILPRTNELNRPKIANIDAALIVTSVVRPTISYNLLDKLIVTVENNLIEPIIVLTKTDLASDKEIDELNKSISYYKSVGYKVFRNDEIVALENYISGKFLVVTGQTGAGKSSLLNKLSPNLELETNEISDALGRGKHTTRHTEFYNIKDYYIADTPGFSDVNISYLTIDELKACFIEFDKYECKFRNCNHFKETGCAVKKAVYNKEILASRYENYLKFGGFE